jgi:hypothetical protein
MTECERCHDHEAITERVEREFSAVDARGALVSRTLLCDRCAGITRSTFGALRQGDAIVCPHSGQEERVTRITPRGDSVFVRTNRHDHLKAAEAEVEVLGR